MNPMQQGFFDTDPIEETESKKYAPLADRVRPETIDEIVGQEHLLGKDMPLRRMIEWDRLASLIFYGPPGTGKTTLAMVIAKATKMHFEKLSAVSAGVKEVRQVTEQAEQRLRYQKRRTLLFIDEIHRFNKSQQDALLPFVEKGIVTLIGATTENPYFSVNKALLSRVQMMELKPLEEEDLRAVLHRALERDDHLKSMGVEIDEDALVYLIRISPGDARAVLGALETVILSAPRIDGKIVIDREHAHQALQVQTGMYDRSGDQHYNTISAFIKSVRGSEPQAALYYLARMLAAGEDPMFIARRLIILASEDIGLANPHALPFAVSTLHAVQHIGLPEGRIPLAQCTIYLASSPKSNTAYLAINEAMQFVSEHPMEDIPSYLKDTHYTGAKDMGHGDGYLYSHNFDDAIAPQGYLPKRYEDARFYRPKPMGEEKNLLEYLELAKKKREKK